jgi:hypothetical protein
VFSQAFDRRDAHKSRLSKESGRTRLSCLRPARHPSEIGFHISRQSESAYGVLPLSPTPENATVWMPLPGSGAVLRSATDGIQAVCDESQNTTGMHCRASDYLPTKRPIEVAPCVATLYLVKMAQPAPLASGSTDAPPAGAPVSGLRHRTQGYRAHSPEGGDRAS